MWRMFAALLPWLALAAPKGSPSGVSDVVSAAARVEAEYFTAKKKGTLGRRHLRQRFQEDLEAAAETPLSSDKAAKLDRALEDPSSRADLVPAPTAIVHSLQSAAEKRAKHRLANRRFKRNPHYSAECGMRIRASDLGLRADLGAGGPSQVQRPGATLLATSALGRGPDAEEEEEDDRYLSWSSPGTGATQTVADNGRSKMGDVHGEEPYATVYKDGFWSAGCMGDLMLSDYDKFGNNKDMYHKDANYSNISIAMYSTLVLKDQQKPMTPRVCFEFCRTVKNMIFFGLNAGRICYCMPFYKPGAGFENDECISPCPGDTDLMCGGLRKSSIFEMHTCGDKEGQLTDKAAATGEALSGFYIAALHASALSSSLKGSGELLESVAGDSGDSGASDLGMEAKKYSGEVNKAFYGECLKVYNTLLTVYEESENTVLLNMRAPENLQKADDAAAVMGEALPKLKDCIKKVEKVIEEGYPAYKDSVLAESEAAMLKAEEAYGRALAGYLPLAYVLDNKALPMQTTCSGEPIGKPIVGTMAECAQACDDSFTETCVGFQYFYLAEEGKDARALCFLLKEVKSFVKYDCGRMKATTEDEKKRLEGLSKEGFLQEAASARKPEKDEGEKKLDKFMCNLPVGQLMLYSSGDCAGLFGPKHSVKDTCSKQCERTKSSSLRAVCVSKFSEISSASPNPQTDTKKECFGGSRNEEVDGAESASPFILQFDDHGAVLSGDANIGAEQVLEPIIWTVADDATQ